MTIKEKIANLVWFDLVAKLKSILTNIDSAISVLSRRISTIESTPSTQNLQGVLDEGNTAVGKSIILQLFDDQTILDASSVQFTSADNNVLSLNSNALGDGISGTNGANGYNNRIILTNREVNGTASFRFNPNLPVGDYNIAIESAITGTFANPTSITVTNGIITAIS